MKRWLSLFLFLVFAAVPIVAQTPPENPAPAPPQPRPFTVEELNNLATRYLREDRNEEAYATAKRAYQRSQQREMRRRASRAANLIGLAAFRLGRVTEAIEYYRESFNLIAEDREEPEVTKLQLAALTRAATLLRLSGRYDEALWCFDQSLRLFRKQNDRAGEALILSRLSGVYAFTGEADRALRYSEEALQIARSLPDNAVQENALHSFLLAHELQGNYQTALQYGLQAVELMLANPLVKNPSANMLTEQRYVRLATLYHLATTYAALEQFAEAVTYFERALNYAKFIRARPDLILGDYAWTQLQYGNTEKALEMVTTALANMKQTGGNSHLEANFLATKAAAERVLGRNEAALQTYRQAVAAVEEARLLSLPTEISRAGIVASRRDVFTAAINFFVEQNHFEEAFTTAESYHARAFLDVLAETGEQDKEEFTPEQKSALDAVLGKIVTIQRELWKPEISADNEKNFTEQLTQAEQELERLRMKFRRANPNIASVKYPKPLAPEIIAKEILPPHTTMIEFVLGKTKSVALVLANGKLSSYFLPPEKEIEAMVAQYNQALTEKVYSLTAMQAINKQKSLAQTLYKTLLQNSEAQCTDAKNLIIVTDGALAYLPFETLVTAQPDPVYLLDKFAVSYAPSASALATIRQLNQPANAATAGVIAFGDPVYEAQKSLPAATERGGELRQLPYTRTEVNEISALFPIAQQKIFLGTEANEKNVKIAALQSYRYVHFAAHGNVDESHPARSGIVLSQLSDPNEDGTLQMPEVMQLKLNADLVTLSACRTGLGKLLHGEGMIGLTRAFLYAGASSVAVSLWNVNDTATASLMKSFYKNLQNGMAKDEALRQAKLELLNSPKRAWRHPYYWAAFVLIGSN